MMLAVVTPFKVRPSTSLASLLFPYDIALERVSMLINFFMVHGYAT